MNSKRVMVNGKIQIPNAEYTGCKKKLEEQEKINYGIANAKLEDEKEITKAPVAKSRL